LYGRKIVIEWSLKDGDNNDQDVEVDPNIKKKK